MQATFNNNNAIQKNKRKIQNLFKWNSKDENAFTNEHHKEQSSMKTPGRSVRNAQRWVISRKMAVDLYMILLLHDCIE